MLSFVSKRSWTMQLKNFWKLLLEICLFDSKKNMNYQIKSNLNLHWIYLVHINHFYTPEIKHVIRGNVCFGKCLFGEISFGELSVGEMSALGIARSGNYPSWKCLSGKFPSGKCLRGTVRQGKVLRGKVHRRNVRRGTVLIPFAMSLNNALKTTHSIFLVRTINSIIDNFFYSL